MYEMAITIRSIHHYKRLYPYFNVIVTRNKSQTTYGTPTVSLTKKVESGQLERDEFQQAVMVHLQRVFDNISDYKPPSKWMKMMFSTKTPKGLYLYGSVGRGKTMLMDIFYDCVETSKKRNVHFNEFMSDVHSRIHAAKIGKKQAKREPASERPQPWDPIAPVAHQLADEAWLLCFDEFQVTDIADAMILKRLFTSLLNNGVIVVATSNRAPEDLYKNGLQRSNFLPFISVLKSHCDVVNLDSSIDYRTRGAPAKQQYYFLTEDQSTNKELDRIFKILASEETDSITSKTLNVKGRNVVFKKGCGGVLDSSFTELCDQALGSADYLQLSQVFHTIIIRDVPRMNLTYRNQARRFIQLIDILYGYRVRIIVSAVAHPQHLFSNEGSAGDDASRMLMDDLQISPGSENAQANIFTGSEELFAFERTVSRLLEMQTDNYWKLWGKY